MRDNIVQKSHKKAKQPGRQVQPEINTKGMIV